MYALPAIRRLIGLLAVMIAFAMAAAACGSDDPDAAGDPNAPSSADADGTDADGADGDGAAEDADDGDTTGETSADESSADGTDDEGGEMEDRESGVEDAVFPIDVETSSGTVTIGSQPERIVSLSPTATEILFAIGAGPQVIAVDLFSNYPPEAPVPSLDGYTPDLEAILVGDPDLVISTGLPADITDGLTAAGAVVMFNPPAASFDDIYDQVAQLGEATGNLDGAASVNAEIREGLEDALAAIPDGDEPIRVFHEIDDSFYTASSASFIGQVYDELGFENIADPLDDGSGFPLIDGESIIAADPTLIVFTDQVAYNAEDIAARPGWSETTAVANGNIVQVDADIASRWGPRIVQFMQTITAAVSVGA